MNSMLSSDVPPIEPGLYVAEPPASKWPTVIGVIGIVLGSLGLLCGCLGYFQVPMQRWGANMAKQAGQADPMMEAQVKVAEQYQIFTLALLTVGMILGVWMLWGTIQLVRRRRSARGTLLGWAMASTLFLAINIAYQSVLFRATLAELTQANAGHRVGELWLGAVIGGIFAVVFGLVFQIFTLIWFSRRKIKEEISLWR